MTPKTATTTTTESFGRPKKRQTDTWKRSTAGSTEVWRNGKGAEIILIKAQKGYLIEFLTESTISIKTAETRIEAMDKIADLKQTY